jgi:hypothetical protein
LSGTAGHREDNMANPKNDNLSSISNTLNSLKEVESYIITDLEGRIHMASTENYSESTINSSIYLWVVGSQLGNEFNLGVPANLIYHRKARKMLIQRFNDYLIILNLIDIAKFPVFKRKLYDLFNRII